MAEEFGEAYYEYAKRTPGVLAEVGGQEANLLQEG